MVKILDLKGSMYSRGVISTWMFIENYNILFDCGDNALTTLFHKLGSIRYIAITHEHFDHISGILALVNARNRIAPNLPLTIILPKTNGRVEKILSMVDRSNIEFLYPKPGENIDIGGKRVLQSFKVKHSANSFGYHIQENRTRLKPEYVGKTQEEYKILSARGVKLSGDFTHTLITFVGDSAPLTGMKLPSPDLLVVEATYITKAERLQDGVYSHSDLESTMEDIKRINPKHAILMHFSGRYTENQIRKATKNLLPNVTAVYNTIHFS